MDKVIVKGYAKVNLSLDILSRREDGYHNIEMLMQTVDLHDVVTIKKICNQKIVVRTNVESLPTDEKNIAYKAANKIIKDYFISEGVDIEIRKNIPIAAGLAGGSTDAAAVIKGMNELFSLNLSVDKMMDIGCMIGADVPFCIVGGTAIVRGIGEKLTVLNKLKNVVMVLVKPPISVSTEWAYKNIDLTNINVRPKTNELLNAVENGDIKFIANNLVNVLETVTISEHDIIHHIKNRLLELNAMGSLMSGSGPTVFGIFENIKSAENAAKILKEENIGTVYIVKSI